MKKKKKIKKKTALKFSLSKLLEEETNKIRTEISQSQKITSHRYSKGYYIEEIIRSFLRNHLPSSLGVSRGFIVDVDGNISSELDIVIFDQSKTPVFYSTGDSRVIPVESVIGVIEVKKNLYTKELKESFQNFESVNKLKKKAQYESLVSQYFFDVRDLEEKLENIDVKKQKEDLEYKIMVDQRKGYTVFGELVFTDLPIMYSIFAYQGLKLNSIKNKVNKFNNERPRKPRNKISSICVFDKGLLLHATSNSVLPFPSGRSELTVIENKTKSLKHFFGMFFNYLLLAKIEGDIKYTDYFRV